MFEQLPRGWSGLSSRDKPWLGRWAAAVSRCKSKTTTHGIKGIKVLMTPDEVKAIWRRDKAHKMKFASLDRIDPTWHYHSRNVRFIPRSINTSRCRYIPHRGRTMKDRLLRIDEKYFLPIQKLAMKEGRSIKSQAERLIETAFALLADRDLGLNSTPWKRKANGK